jgi:bacterioferritin-associated ferredoxin
MIICSCNVISDGDVRAVVGPQSGAASTAQVYRGLGHEPQCGRCAGSIRKIMDEVPDPAAPS